MKMYKTNLLVILMCWTNLGISSNQVSVLKYKGGEECSSALVGVPLTSLAASSPLEEFTFCGMYHFRFLQGSFLVGIEPTSILRIWSFNTNSGYLLHQGTYYRFYFVNQSVTLDSWQNICLAISPTLIKIAWNGEILLSDPRVDFSKEESTNAKLWFGGATFSDEENNQRFKGMIAKANFWIDALKDEELISITNNGQAVIGTTKFDLLSVITHKNSTCIDYLSLDEKDALFHEKQQQKTILIEYKTDFDSSNYLCQAYGGNLTLPKNDEDLNILGSLIQQSDVCSYSFLGLTKSTNEEILDLKGNIMAGLKWGLKQPNGRMPSGKETQECIEILSVEALLNDIECNIKKCFFCTLPEKNIFILRGLIPMNAERKYFVAMNVNDTEIRGITGTECFWNERKWKFGKNLKVDNVTNNMPPVGLKTWNNGQKLKFTQCKKDEFTCHTYGHCILMNKRCDGKSDCPLDGSDENDCKQMTFEKGYDKLYPSAKNTTVFISMEVLDVLETNELQMEYTVELKIKLNWFDTRIIFRNLKPSHYENQLTKLEIEKIWTPNLLLLHSNQIQIRAGVEKEGEDGTVRIYRQSLPHQNNLSETDEDYLYPGIENQISMVNYIVVKLGCKIDLTWYPFDTQKCPIEIMRPTDFYNQFVIKWLEPPKIENITLTEYEVLQYLEYDNRTSTKILVKVVFCRKLSYHVFNIYLPTLCLVIIAALTLFVDLSHFEATIMVALTSMLVTYTLYQSISAHLPPTSFMKMIDIWLIGGLLFPFFIIVILVIMDALIIKEKNRKRQERKARRKEKRKEHKAAGLSVYSGLENQVINVKNEGEKWFTPKLFKKGIQVTLIVASTIFGTIYWSVGLYHYYLDCDIF